MVHKGMFRVMFQWKCALLQICLCVLENFSAILFVHARAFHFSYLCLFVLEHFIALFCPCVLEHFSASMFIYTRALHFSYFSYMC